MFGLVKWGFSDLCLRTRASGTASRKSGHVGTRSRIVPAVRPRSEQQASIQYWILNPLTHFLYKICQLSIVLVQTGYVNVLYAIICMHALSCYYPVQLGSLVRGCWFCWFNRGKWVRVLTHSIAAWCCCFFLVSVLMVNMTWIYVVASIT